MKELSFEEKIKMEALERLKILETTPIAIEKFQKDRGLTKCIVDHKNKTLNDETKFTEDELKLVREIEEKYDIIVYYVIQDEGMWPEGGTFPRYTLLYVSKCEEEWEMDKEDCMKGYKTVPAYVVNREEPDYSEFAECAYKVVRGKIINLT